MKSCLKVATSRSLQIAENTAENLNRQRLAGIIFRARVTLNENSEFLYEVVAEAWDLSQQELAERLGEEFRF
jgi:hypothetical protein